MSSIGTTTTSPRPNRSRAARPGRASLSERPTSSRALRRGVPPKSPRHSEADQTSSVGRHDHRVILASDAVGVGDDPRNFTFVQRCQKFFFVPTSPLVRMPGCRRTRSSSSAVASAACSLVSLIAPSLSNAVPSRASVGGSRGGREMCAVPDTRVHFRARVRDCGRDHVTRMWDAIECGSSQKMRGAPGRVSGAAWRYSVQRDGGGVFRTTS